MSEKPDLEARFERGLFASRWLMAPMYLGLIVTLALLLVIFVRDLFYYVPQVMTMSADRGILVVLTFIDLTLAANLVVIVLFSGYENFVSKLDLGEEAKDRPSWMGTVDFSGLKMKVIASIVAISAISLLKRFMEIGDPSSASKYGPEELFWMTIIHLTFVISGVLLALMDWLVARSGKY